MSKFLDYSGLQYYNSKLKQKFTEKVSGKQLSTNDFTDAYKTKLDDIINNESRYVNTEPNWLAESGTPGYINNKPTTIETANTALNANMVNGHTVDKDVPSNAVFTDTTYDVFVGASASDNGKSGLIPKPNSGDQNKYLKGDGTWSSIDVPNVNLANGDTEGLVKSGGDVDIDNGVITVKDNSHNHTISNISGLQDSLNSKVENTLTINNKPLNGDITLSADDIQAISISKLGVANGVATLNSNGKITESQLPSYIDDVVDGYINTADNKFYKEDTFQTAIDGESGKIYLDISTNRTYRWSGSASNTFVQLYSGLVLGDTSSTAGRGDLTKEAHDHAVSVHAPTNAEPNVIESIRVNDTPLTVANKAVNIDLTSYVLSSDLNTITNSEIDSLFSAAVSA